MKSTPVSATARIVSRVTPPEASSAARPAVSSTARRRSDGRHVVEQDPVGAGGERLADLVERVALDLDRRSRQPAARSRSTAVRDSSGEAQVVVLDEDRVVEAQPVVRAAAAAHGVLLERAQAGRRLARVEEDRAGARDGVRRSGA